MRDLIINYSVAQRELSEQLEKMNICVKELKSRSKKSALTLSRMARIVDVTDELIEKEQQLLAEQQEVDRALAVAANKARIMREMMSDLQYALEWMRTGCKPNNYGENNAKKAYDRKILLNMELFPSLDIYPSDVEKEQAFDEKKKQAVTLILATLTERQLTCFLAYEVHQWTESKIGEALGINRQNVNRHVRTARNKIKNIVAQYEFEL